MQLSTLGMSWGTVAVAAAVQVHAKKAGPAWERPPKLLMDRVSKYGARDHPHKECEDVVELALRERHARQLGAIFVGYNWRRRRRNPGIFEQVHNRYALIGLRGPGAALA